MSLRELLEVVRYPGLFLFAFLMFFESGNEAVLGGWTSTYFGSFGASARTATYVLAAFWGALMVGRICATHFLTLLRDSQLVFTSAVCSLFGCVVLASSHTDTVAAAAVAFTGFAFAAIYPTALAMVGDRYRRYAGTVFGVLFAIGLSGGAVFPWAVGQIAQATSVRWGMRVPIAGTCAVTALAFTIMRRYGSNTQRTGPQSVTRG